MENYQGVHDDLSRGAFVTTTGGMQAIGGNSGTQGASTGQPAAVDLNTIHNMTASQLKAVADTSLSLLPESDQDDVAARAGFGRPNQGIVNWLWLIVVVTFALVLLGATGSLIYAVIFLQRSADSVQVVVSVFTAVVGFLGGLFLPSPVQSANNGNASGGKGKM
jgi:hypothetical protein